MLRHWLPRYRRLVRDGEQTEGLVLGVEELQTGTIGHSEFRLRIRARLPGGESEVMRAVDSHELRGAYPEVGERVPLRFDPAKLERIEVDLPAWRSRLLEESERIEAESLRQGKDKWDAGESG